MFINDFIQQHSWLSYALISLYVLYVFIELTLCINKKAFEMDERPLTKQYLFKQSIRIPLLSSFYFGLFSWLGHSPQFNSDGFNNFIAISKLPIALLSLSIPFVAVVANIHRTVQTNRQIQEAKQKNLSDSHYSHLKFVTDYFTNLPGQIIHRKRHLEIHEITCKVSYPIHLYRYIFDESNPEKGRPAKANKEYIKKINKYWLEILKSMESFASSNKGLDINDVLVRQMQALHSIEFKLLKLNRMLCLTTVSLNEHASLSTEGYQIFTNFMSSSELGNTIATYFKFTIDILDITDNFFSYKDDASSGKIFMIADLIAKYDVPIFQVISTYSGKTDPLLTFNGDKVAAES
ncbi:hypothetical protein ABQ485_02135 [Citrobacter portucalensis]|uniref:hypothetical protein n=1 Tax=Citrobacter portucalensis TaxID=1639133 RepID=UPI003AAFCD9B